MSTKRVPVYLSCDEMRIIERALIDMSFTNLYGVNIESLKERISEELERNDEEE
jgi:hypothetical protein